MKIRFSQIHGDEVPAGTSVFQSTLLVGLMLIGGLALGTVAAIVAVLPQMLLGAARIPLTDLAILLSIVLVAGIATGFIAVRATLRAPLVAALRGE